jgi:hypothetical protein
LDLSFSELLHEFESSFGIPEDVQGRGNGMNHERFLNNHKSIS